ncbi:hypothetical protein, partial [Xanthomonas fragariae]|uniref:hypothetical protein n=1 Tax=Xanthomonas fragariae TaxID=48664 RepID=UPI001F25AA41
MWEIDHASKPEKETVNYLVAPEKPSPPPITTTLYRPHRRARTTSFRYAEGWFLAISAHAYTPSCCRDIPADELFRSRLENQIDL